MKYTIPPFDKPEQRYEPSDGKLLYQVTQSFTVLVEATNEEEASNLAVSPMMNALLREQCMIEVMPTVIDVRQINAKEAFSVVVSYLSDTLE